MRNLGWMLLALAVASSACRERASDRVARSEPAPTTASNLPMATPSQRPETSPAPSSSPPRTRTSCPPTTVFVTPPGVCIHQWEVQLFYGDGRLHDPFQVPPRPEQMTEMVVAARAGVVPQGYLGREQAEIACRNTRHGEFRFRLCTTAEWEAACRGPNAEFPAYQDAMVERCNTGKFPDREHLVYRFYPEPQWTFRELTDRRINQEPGGLARTGAYSRCTNGFGVFDMVGNLQEWTADLRPKGELMMSTLKGDHYMGQGKNYVGCAATNTAHFYLEPSDPEYALYKDWKDYSTGVRCCTDPR